MASTCLDIVTYALRMNRVVAVGRDPKPAETEEGLVALQSLYDHWRTNGMFGTLEDIYLDSDDVAEEGKRYYVPAGITLTAPTNDYVAGCDSTTRQPRDLAMYESLTAAGTQSAMLYDRTAWVPLLGLALSDTAPLSGRGAYGLAACLATYGGFIAAFGGQPQETTGVLAKSFMRNIVGKTGSTQDDSGSDYF